jgi:hypothetical protein
MQTALEIVGKVPDSEVTALAKAVFDTVFAEIPYGDVRRNSESVAEVSALLALDRDALTSDLSAAESARLGRLVLEQFARDPGLAPFIERAWEDLQKSDKLVVDVILTLGLLVNLALLVATTEVHVRKGKDGKTTWELKKRNAEPKLVKEFVRPIAAVAKAIL